MFFRKACTGYVVTSCLEVHLYLFEMGKIQQQKLMSWRGMLAVAYDKLIFLKTQLT